MIIMTATENEIRHYYSGVREGIRRYAIYSNGEQLVGVLRKPLKEVLQKVRDEEEAEIADI